MSGRKGLWGLCAACGVGHGLRSLLQGEEEVDPPQLRPLRVDQSVQPLGPAKQPGREKRSHWVAASPPKIYSGPKSADAVVHPKTRTRTACRAAARRIERFHSHPAESM